MSLFSRRKFLGVAGAGAVLAAVAPTKAFAVSATGNLSGTVTESNGTIIQVSGPVSLSSDNGPATISGTITAVGPPPVTPPTSGLLSLTTVHYGSTVVMPANSVLPRNNYWNSIVQISGGIHPYLLKMMIEEDRGAEPDICHWEVTNPINGNNMAGQIIWWTYGVPAGNYCVTVELYDPTGATLVDSTMWPYSVAA